MNLYELNQLKIERSELKTNVLTLYQEKIRQQLIVDKIKRNYHKAKFDYLHLDRIIAEQQLQQLKAKVQPKKRTRKTKKNKMPARLIKLLSTLSPEEFTKAKKLYEEM